MTSYTCNGKGIASRPTKESVLRGVFSGLAERLLEQVRPPGADFVPDELLIRSPLAGAEAKAFRHPFDKAVFAAASSLHLLKGKVLAFDLDDTLLNTNFICKEAWAFPPGLGPEPETALSIQYHRLRHPLSYWIKAGWKRPRRLQYDSTRYAFLRNPDVVAQLRPGALALLHGLRAAGATLVLMTISARQRLDFLFDRMPGLRDAFTPPDGSCEGVVSAQDLTRFALSFEELPESMPHELDADMDALWTGGLEAHRDAPGHFGIKSLPALTSLTGNTRLDLLVDDSSEGAEVYARNGMEATFLKAPALEPHGLAVPELLDRIARRFGGQTDIEPRQEDLRNMLAHGYPWVRVEDPLYFPLVHTKATLPPTPSLK